MSKITIENVFSEGNINKAIRRGKNSKGTVLNINSNTFIEKVGFLKIKVMNGTYKPNIAKQLFESDKYIFVIEDKIFQLLIYTAYESQKVKDLKCVTGYLKDNSIFTSLNAFIDFYKNNKSIHIYKADIKHFFDSIDLSILKGKFYDYFDDNCVLVLDRVLKQEVVKNHQIVKKSRGLIFGSILSPLFSNIYLRQFDQSMMNYYDFYTRYSDDMLFACKIEDDCTFCKNSLNGLKLEVENEKSRKVNMDCGFIFLGYYLRKDCYMKIEDKIKNDIEDRNLASINRYFNHLTKKQIFKVLNLYRSDVLFNIIAINTIRDENDRIIELDYYDILKKVIVDIAEEDIFNLMEAVQEKLFELNYYFLANEIDEILKKDVRIDTAPIKNIDYKEYINKFLKYYANYSVLYVDGNSQVDSYVVEAEITNEAINKMIAERKAYGIKGLDKNDRSRFIVIDLDIDKRFFIEFGEDDKKTKEQLKRCFEIALSIKSEIEKNGMDVYIEYSGMKGYHLWLFFNKPIKINSLKSLVNRFIPKKDLKSYINIELIPNMTYDENELIKIPLSYHPKTGVQALFINEKGIAYEDQMSVFDNLKYNSFETKYKIEKLEKHIEVDSKDRVENQCIELILKNCVLIRKIVERAMSDSYLTHYERNALLYVFGHMGQEGENYLHYVISQTINYSQKITNAYIEKIKSNPVSCKKLKKRFENIYNLKGCNCSFEKYIDFYDSPVIHAYEKFPDIITKPINPDSISKLIKLNEFGDKKDIDAIIDHIFKLNKEKIMIEKELEANHKQLQCLFDEENICEYQAKSGKIIKQGREIYIKIL